MDEKDPPHTKNSGDSDSESTSLSLPILDDSKNKSEEISEVSEHISSNIDSVENDRSFQEIEIMNNLIEPDVEHISQEKPCALDNSDKSEISLNFIQTLENQVLPIYKEDINSNNSYKESPKDESFDIFANLDLDDKSLSKMKLSADISLDEKNLNATNFALNSTDSELTKRIKEFEELVALKDNAIAALTTELDSIKESSNLNTGSTLSTTEYKQLQDEWHVKMAEYTTTISYKNEIIQQLTDSLEQSVKERNDMAQEILEFKKQMDKLKLNIRNVDEEIPPDQIKSDVQLDKSFELISPRLINENLNNEYVSLEKTLNLTQQKLLQNLNSRFNAILEEEIAKHREVYDLEVKTLKDNMAIEKEDFESEIARHRKLLDELKSGSAHLLDIRNELEAKHSQEVEELRTYFEQKCAELEKNYSDEIFSHHSRKISSSSCSEAELNSDVPFSNPSGPEGDCLHANQLNLNKKDIINLQNELNSLINKISKCDLDTISDEDFTNLKSEIGRSNLLSLLKFDASPVKIKHKISDSKNYEQKYEEMKDEYEDKLNDTKEKYEREIAYLRDQLENFEKRLNITSTAQEVGSSGEFEITEVIQSYERRLQEQVSLAKLDIISALELQIQHLASNETSDDEWPTELLRLRDKFKEKYEAQMKTLIQDHKREIETLKDEHLKVLNGALERSRRRSLRDDDSISKVETQAIRERDILQRQLSALRKLLGELVRYFTQCEDELNNTLVDELLKNGFDKNLTQIEEELNLTISSPNSSSKTSDSTVTRVHLIPNVTDLINLIESSSTEDGDSRDISIDLKNELELCLEKLKHEANAILALTNNIRSSTDPSTKNLNLEEQVSSLTRKLFIEGQVNDDLESQLKEIQVYAETLEKEKDHRSGQKEIISESYGEQDSLMHCSDVRKQKMFLILKSFVFFMCIGALNSECSFLNEVFSCHNTDIVDLYKEYFRDKWKTSLVSISEIKVFDSNISKIEYFYKLPQLGNITTLEFINCQLSMIHTNAFHDFKRLKKLDLSHNQLKEVYFTILLSVTLEKLSLGHNNILFIDINFSKWKNLKLLDLSFNQITSIDFQVIRAIPTINFSHNRINSIVPYQMQYLGELDFVKLNISRNDLDTYDEHQFFVIIDWLDLSYNNLKVVNMKYSKNYLSLAHSKVVSFDEKISVKYADLTAVDGIEQVKLISDHLVLKNNRFGDLATFKIDLRSFYDNTLHHLDLSNSSITSIPENYFTNIIDCYLLNLSYNNIVMIKEHTFRYSNIQHVDLSHSNVKSLEVASLKDGIFGVFKLNNNKISGLNRAFQNTSITHVDLSFNLLTHLRDSFFENLSNVKILDLSNCFIRKIDAGAFKTLDYLEYLDLSYNNLTVVESKVFDQLSIGYLNLKGNGIKALNSHSFSNLHNITELDLSDMKIETIANSCFYNLSIVREINLSNNNIQLVHSNLFIETPALKRIDLSDNPINTLNRFSNKISLIDLILSFKGTLQSDQISNFHIENLTLKNSCIKTVKNGSFKGLYSLKYLYFNNSDIKNVESNALIELFNLQFLDAQNLFKNIKILKEGMFQDLNKVDNLNLSNTNLYSIESKAFYGLNRAELLQLNDNQIKEIVDDTFVGLGFLTELNLSNNRITTLQTNCFFGLDSLKILLLSDNGLNDLAENIFAPLSQLEILDLQNNKLTVLHNDRLKGIPNLLELNLSRNNLKTLKTGVFQYLPELRYLNLMLNNLGEFGSPQHSFKFGVLSNLKRLEYLDLTYNHFSTLIVKNVFMSLKSLRQLHLNHNDLKLFDFDSLLVNSKEVEFVGISYNKWHCEYLSNVIELLYNKSVNYMPQIPIFDDDNIEGDPMKSLAEIEEKARNLLSQEKTGTDPALLRLLHEFCRVCEKVKEEAKRDRYDLIKQIEAADKKYKFTQKFLEEQAMEREQERDEAQKRIDSLINQLKDRDKDKAALERTNSEVERLEHQLQEKSAALELALSKLKEVESERKDSIEKNIILREIIRDLESQTESKSKEIDQYVTAVKKLQCIVEQQDKVSEKLADNSTRNITDVDDLYKHLDDLENEVQTLRLQSELAGNEGASKQFRKQLYEIECQVDRKTKELETLHSTGSTNCSSPSEDVSAREVVFPKSPKKMEDCEVPLQQLARLKEKLIRHSRAEDAAMKRIRDLEMQVFRLKQEAEETSGEREYLRKQIQEQLVLISDLQIRLDEQRIRGDNIEKQNNTAFELKIYDLQNEIAALKEKLQQKEKAIGNQQVLLAETQERLRNLENELATSKDDELLVGMQKEIEMLRKDNGEMKDKMQNDANMVPNLVENIISDKNSDMARLRMKLDDTEKLLEEYTTLKLDKKDLQTLANIKNNGTSLEELFSILDLSRGDTIRKMEQTGNFSTPSLFAQKKIQEENTLAPDISAILGPGHHSGDVQSRNSTELSKKVHFEDDFKKEIADLKNQIETRDNRIKEFDEKMKILNNLESKIEKLQAALDETEKILSTTKETFEMEQKELKEKINNLTVTITEKKLHLEEAQKRIQILEDDSKRKDTAYQDLVRENKKLDKELNTTINLLKSKCEELDVLTTQHSLKSSEVAALQKRINHISAELFESDSRYKKLKETLKNNEGEMDNLHRELDSKLDQIESITNELSNTKEKLSKKRKIVRELQDSVESQTKQLDILQGQRKQQDEIILDKSAATDILTEDIDRYKLDISILENEIKKLKQGDVAKLKNQLEEKETKLSELNGERNRLEELIKEKEKIIVQMTEDSHQLHANLTSIQSKINESGNLIDLGRKLKKEQKKTAELMQEIHSLKAQLMQYRSNDMTSSVDEIADQLKKELDYSNKIDSSILIAVSDQSLNSISETHDVETYKKALAKERLNKKQLLQHVHKLQSKINALQDDLDKERSALNQNKIEEARVIQELKIQLHTLMKNDEELKKSLRDKNTEKENLEEELNRLKAKNSQSESTEYKKLPSNEAIELKQLRRNFDVLQGEKNQLTNELNNLKRSQLEMETGYKCTKDMLALEVQRKNKFEEKVHVLLVREKELKDSLMRKNLEMERVVDEMSQEKADLVKQKLELLQRLKCNNPFKARNTANKQPSGDEFLEKIEELNNALIDNKKFIDLISRLTNEKKRVEYELDIAKRSNKDFNMQVSTNDLMARADYLFAKTLKLESIRKALVFQKSYLMGYLISHKRECSVSALPDPIVQRQQFRLEFTLKHRFRAHVFAVISLIRMKYLVRRWNSGVRLAGNINSRHYRHAGDANELAYQASSTRFQVGQPVSSQFFQNVPSAAPATRNLNPFRQQETDIVEEDPWSGNSPPSKENYPFRSKQEVPQVTQLLDQFAERFENIQENLRLNN
ncbi:unnamed protein product [Phyllotreta striolata]|uniref:Pericentrin/AKAP-450 centrosomal targeting domain-containing protein n=1 Tax=Phyllotreta striolata TaxID=444603 RepID=A0A9N9XSR2_PHYSR|nr:unnamed protein product [Phyllotreta striolata]